MAGNYISIHICNAQIHKIICSICLRSILKDQNMPVIKQYKKLKRAVYSCNYSNNLHTFNTKKEQENEKKRKDKLTFSNVQSDYHMNVKCECRVTRYK